MNSSLKPPPKRRKLLKSTTPSPTSTPGVRPLASTTIMNANKGTMVVCVSCQRALVTSTAGSVIQCSICASTTCAVCSRTCTHSAASQPPTPRLTWSPTPTPSPAPSPRRSVLSLNASSANLPVRETPLTPTQTNGVPKRRKSIDEDVEVKDQEVYGPGCGKLICRNCCYEDTHNNTTTCLGCYGSRG